MRSSNPSLAGLSPWRMIVGLGTVSLTIDMVADGAMSVNGAFLAQLGASALLVGLVTGGADAVALLLRLVTDRGLTGPVAIGRSLSSATRSPR